MSIICEGKQVDELERAGAVFGPNTTYGSSGSVGISVGGGGGGGYWEGGEEAVERIGRVMMNLEGAVEGGDDNDGDNASESERESRDRDTQERESRKREREKERKEWEEREKREREREEREWVREVTKSLESLASVAVSEGYVFCFKFSLFSYLNNMHTLLVSLESCVYFLCTRHGNIQTRKPAIHDLTDHQQRTPSKSRNYISYLTGRINFFRTLRKALAAGNSIRDRRGTFMFSVSVCLFSAKGFFEEGGMFWKMPMICALLSTSQHFSTLNNNPFSLPFSLPLKKMLTQFQPF